MPCSAARGRRRRAETRSARLVPAAAREAAEGEQADQGHDDADPEAPEDGDDDPDDDEDPADADSTHCSLLSRRRISVLPVLPPWRRAETAAAATLKGF